jgi:hypothetical protein
MRSEHRRKLAVCVGPAALGQTGWKIEITGENADESPYVAMTSKLVEVFPQHGGTFQIEPDASSGSYFWAADWVLWIARINQEGKITSGI